jgi:hypothetical protein
MTVKVLMEFSSSRYSWSESHVYNGTSNPGDPALVSVLTNLAALRVACLGLGAFMNRIRVSQVGSPGSVVDYFCPPFPASSFWILPNPNYNPVLLNAEVIGLAVLCRMFSTLSFARSNIYLAGAPMGCFGENGPDSSGLRWDQVPGLLNRINAYLAYLFSGSGFGFETRTETTFQPAQSPLVTNGAVPGQVGIVLAAPLAPNVPQGTQLLVRGWRRVSTRTPGLTGVYSAGPTIVTAGPPATYTYFLQRTAQVSPSNFFTQGKLGLFNSVFAPYLGGAIVEATTRKRGASLGAPRGRSSIRS